MGQNVIELNGKRYDAITGAYLGKSHVVPKHISDSFARGRVIDGFVRPTGPKPKSPQVSPITATVKSTEIKKTAPTTFRRTPSPAKHAVAHNPEKSKTLMRRAIQRPEFKIKPAIKTQAPAEIMAKPASAIAHKRSAYGIDPSRKVRASIVPQHDAIKHFHLAEKPATVKARPAVPVIPVRPAPLHAATRPVASKSQPDIFDKAIARASSHEQPMHKIPHRRKHRKLVNSLAIVATFLIIGGFFTYLNFPQLQLKYASMEAGFGASMPRYLPTGFALDKGVEHSGGTISLSYRSGDQSFRITQQSSDWNSQTLLDNTLALNDPHQTVQKDGQTIYIYNDGANAAWVNGGVRYDITGNAQLSTDDIVSIATSM